MRVLCARSNKRGLVETRTKRLQPHPCPRAPAHANSLPSSPRARTPLRGHYLGSNMGASGAPAGFSGEMCAAMSFGAQPPTEGLAEYVKSELMPMTPAGPQKKTRRHHDGSARTAGQPSSQGGSQWRRACCWCTARARRRACAVCPRTRPQRCQSQCQASARRRVTGRTIALEGLEGLYVLEHDLASSNTERRHSAALSLCGDRNTSAHDVHSGNRP